MRAFPIYRYLLQTGSVVLVGVSSVSCVGYFGPLLTCPASLGVGEEAVLSASQVDDALLWTIDKEDQTGAVFVLPDGTETKEATTSVIGDPGFATGTTVITIRADGIGTLRIGVKEILIGPAIGLPRPQGSATCTIEIRAAAN